VKLDIVAVHDGLCASFLLAKIKQVAKPIQPHNAPLSECPKSCTEKLLDSHCAKAARRTATTQRDPIIGECCLVPGKQCVVADKADLATGTVFEGVFSLCTRLSADQLWPVIQRRRVVATKADRIRSLTIAERDEPGPGGDFVSILGIPDGSGEKSWCLALDHGVADCGLATGLWSPSASSSSSEGAPAIVEQAPLGGKNATPGPCW
jgi:hypothetical protein